MDKGENGEVRYELIKGHGELFKVCRKTGEITLKQNLEGHNREYELIIAAYDGGKLIYSNNVIAIRIPTQSFTSPNTNLSYPITTLADCKSSNLVYQLQCMKCNDFYVGETGQMLSKHMNGHQFTVSS